MEYVDKLILGVGPGSGAFLRDAAVGGAAGVERIRFSTADAEHHDDDIMAWRSEHNADVVLRHKTLTAFTLEDEAAFDLIAVSGVGHAEIQPVLERLHRALKPGGRLVWLKNEGVELASPAPAQSIAQRQRNVILHVHNVAWIGGTGNFVYDFAKCFPEFHHVAVHVNSPKEDEDWLNWSQHHMECRYAEKITRSLIEEIDPQIIMLHNTAGGRVEGSWQLEIADDRFIIAVHHNPTRPLFRSHVDVFVSEHVKTFYSAIYDRMQQMLVIPPCTDLAPFAAIPRDVWAGDLTITTAGKAGDSMKQFMKDFPALGIHPGPETRGMEIMPGYLRRFNTAIVWSGHKETWCRTVTECLAAGMLVIAHNSGAIPEQVKDGENGFLFDHVEDLALLIARVKSLPVDERDQISKEARESALNLASFEKMRTYYNPVLMRAVLAG